MLCVCRLVLVYIYIYIYIYYVLCVCLRECLCACVYVYMCVASFIVLHSICSQCPSSHQFYSCFSVFISICPFLYAIYSFLYAIVFFANVYVYYPLAWDRAHRVPREDFMLCGDMGYGDYLHILDFAISMKTTSCDTERVGSFLNAIYSTERSSLNEAAVEALVMLKFNTGPGHTLDVDTLATKWMERGHFQAIQDDNDHGSKVTNRHLEVGPVHDILARPRS